MNAAVGTGPMLRLLAMLPAPTRTQRVGMYRDTLNGQIRAIEAAVAGEPPAELKAVVHKLAGSAAMMQDSDLSLPARAMERALMDGRMTDAKAQWPLVRCAAAQTLAALEGL